jgi:hypothetical protein
MNQTSRILLGLCVAAALAALSWWLTISGGPTVWQPLNLVLVIPLMVLGAPSPIALVVAVAAAPVAYLAWCAALLRDGRPQVPTRSFVLFFVAAGISVFMHIFGSSYAAEYQGWAYLKGVWIISALWWVGLTGLALLAQRKPSFAKNFTFHAALFTWLTWYAIPYMGELP